LGSRPALTVAFGFTWLYRAEALRYDDVQPVRALTQSLSVGIDSDSVQRDARHEAALPRTRPDGFHWLCRHISRIRRRQRTTVRCSMSLARVRPALLVLRRQ
jgi:hypothetical protein